MTDFLDSEAKAINAYTVDGVTLILTFVNSLSSFVSSIKSRNAWHTFRSFSLKWRCSIVMHQPKTHSHRYKIHIFHNLSHHKVRHIHYWSFWLIVNCQLFRFADQWSVEPFQTEHLWKMLIDIWKYVEMMKIGRVTLSI